MNTLAGAHALARTSSSPGRTQTINFYLIDEQMYFVDIPGYGYAKVPKQVQAGWRNMIESYLHNRDMLKLALILVDSRIPPTSGDIQMKTWFDYNRIPSAIIVTKADKLSKTQLTQALRKSAETLNTEEIIPFSAVTHLGKDVVWKKIRTALKN